MFIVLISQLLIAQNEGNIWYFGNGAGLDFNSGAPVPLNDGMLNTLEGCASISDVNGDLLFYTDGMLVYDKFHNIMPNGTGLLGNNSSTQSAIIVKQPQSSDIYYIFTVDGYSGFSGNGLYYSEVDMTLNGGAGDVTAVKNVLLFQNAAEKVTAIPHSNGVDFWIISPQHTTNLFNSYLFTPAGINSTPVQSSVDDVEDTVGYLSASPDGTKIASCYYHSNSVDVLNFDNSTGMLSFNFTLNNIHHAYGASFSPNSNVLYLGFSSGVYQCNLMAGQSVDIINSLILIDDNNGDTAMQLGPDGKIYHANPPPFSAHLSVIEYPDIVGVNCSYSYNSLELADGTTAKYGLPTFFSSIFNMPSIVSSSNYCYGDSTYFELSSDVDSVVWNFDDYESGASNISNLNTPSHFFSSPGVYNVEVLIHDAGTSSTHIESVEINDLPVVDIGVDTILCNQTSIALEVNSDNVSCIWQDNSTNSTFQVENTGLYWVEVADSSCVFRDSIYVDFLSVDVDLGEDLLLCYGDSLDLAPDDIYDLYEWSNGVNQTSINVSDEGVYWLEAGTEWCKDRDSVFVEVAESTLAIMSGLDSICDGGEFNDAKIIVEGEGPFIIDYTNGAMSSSVSGESPFDIEIAEEGVYTITAIVDTHGCNGEFEGEAQFVLVEDPLSVFNIVSTNGVIQDLEYVFENESEGHSSCYWNFGTNWEVEDNSSEINYSYREAGTYRVELVVHNEFGCADTSAQMLTITPYQYFLPNAFTPFDQNNINDSFGLENDNVTSFEMIIFDRWGGVVYRTNDVSAGWDGKRYGVCAQSGCYSYLINLEDPLGNPHKLIGLVNLID